MTAPRYRPHARAPGACAPPLNRSVPLPGGGRARRPTPLQRRLLAQQTRSWEFDLDEGLLDELNLLVHPIVVGDGLARLSRPMRRRSSTRTPR